MNTFTKAERLSSKLLIDKLIENGKSFTCFPFRIVWLEMPENIEPLQIVISVPKRLFKKAVHRNRLKRLTREAYRLNKHLLMDTLTNKKVLILFVFTGKMLLEFKEVETAMIDGLKKLEKKINTPNL